MPNPIRVNEAKELTPKPTSLGAWAEQLRNAALHAIEAKDMEIAMEALVKKAQTGDLASLKFLLEFVGKAAPQIKIVAEVRPGAASPADDEAAA